MNQYAMGGLKRLASAAVFGLILVSRAPAAGADGLPDLSVTLGWENVGTGLVVPASGDGVNAPVVVQGVSARRIAGEGSSYLYVVIGHPAYTRGPVDVYVTVEFLDENPGRLRLEYDRTGGADQPAARYVAAGETLLLTGSNAWRQAVFHLPDLRLGHGQNWGADFRLIGRRLAVRRITVSPKPPAGYVPGRSNNEPALRALAVTRRPGMELTFGNDASPSDAALFRALSVTSVESYVDWAGVEPQEGKWDWSRWDRQVEVLRKNHLKWVPFLIAGPAYATPAWFREGAEAHVYRCLEHGQDSKVQTLFNPRLRPRIERFLEAFARRYGDSGVIESVLIGVSGIYGESIYPAGPEGGWTAERTGNYHNHAGWWMADPLAVAAFRDEIRARYLSVDRLNRAWGTSFRGFEEVGTFLPEKAPGDRARADVVEWYQQAMTDWCVFWVGAARRALPKAEIYLCTGGDGNPLLGADFTAQTRAIAHLGAGVRITNEGSSYLHNFTLTREVATATRHAGTFCGIEPASAVNAPGIVGRIYNATASGARQLHDYTPNTLGDDPASLKNFRANAGLLVPRKPRVDVALYLSRETWALDPGAIDRTYALARSLRDVVDIDFVTRVSTAGGHLSGYRTLVLTESEVLEPRSAETIESWVRGGGTLIATSRPGAEIGGRLYDLSAWRSRLFATGQTPAEPVRPALAGPAPSRWVLNVGGEGDQPWLTGDWNGREDGHEWLDIPGSTMRWSAARSGVFVPNAPGAAHTLTLSLSAPPVALGRDGIEVRLDGQPLGRIRQPGRQEVTYRLPARTAGQASVGRLEFVAKGWRPSETSPGSRDERLLGFSLRQVVVRRDGAGDVPPSPATLRYEVVPEVLKPCTRIVGSGRTIRLKDRAAEPTTVATVVASSLPGLPDGRLDGQFATVTDEGILWYDPASHQIELKARP